MKNKPLTTLLNPQQIQQQIAASLAEDLGSGDISAALIPPDTLITATITNRESAILCGKPWVNEVYQQLDPKVEIHWQANDGDSINPKQVIATLKGQARSLLSGERTALNWLQTLSGTATTTYQYQQQLANTSTQLLDTRKTIPGLRLAQKYAVQCGGGCNHRLGLFDAYLIKENHLMSAGSILAAIQQARTLTKDKLIEVEVENFDELEQALQAKADIIMLDNFSLNDIKKAVAFTKRRAKLEVSGNVSLAQLKQIAATGVDYISVGALSKHLRAIDLSMRFQGS